MDFISFIGCLFILLFSLLGLGFLYLLAIVIIKWTGREEMPDSPRDLAFARWLYCTVWGESPETMADYNCYCGAMVFTCIIICLAILLVGLFIYYPIGTIITIGIAGVIIGALFFTRWVRDIKRALDECREEEI